MSRPLLRVLTLCSTLAMLAAQDAWDALVRGTDARTPAEERAGFKLPPGFEIQLVASEPDIGKPMNLAFDAKGRLWVTSTLEYPWAVADGTKGRDAVKVLAGIGVDGKASSITTFVDGLNIPIGLYPYQDGVIAFDIPTIKFHRDTDGDGKADKSEKLYGTFGRDDTHGMTNAFRRGPDGWLYACHGFKNKSTVTGADGSSITMNSGSTYRMRVDGSRVERHTYGQVNPFGMAVDDWGNLFTSDCHSKPIYQVLRGAWYPSFGAPHDGLGYGPEMMSHMHGSTGLCGVAWYGADSFPSEFRNNLFVCNVVTSKVNRDALESAGSTRNAKELADFITCDDPWFRPVDLTVGPDGALYIADFYNKIIGHYEVDLKHPGRDRHRGRIWRVVYTGAGAKPTLPDLAAMDATALVAALGDANPTVRSLAADQLTDRLGASASSAVSAMFGSSTNAQQRYHGLWTLHRLGAVTSALLDSALSDKEPKVRAAAIGILAETATWTEAQRVAVLARLADDDAQIRRAAADALGLHPHVAQVKALLDALQAADQRDTHLVYKLRQALRDQVRDDAVVVALPSLALALQDSALITDLATAAATPAAAKLVLARLTSSKDDGDTVLRQARHVARNLPAEELAKLTTALRARTDLDAGRHAALFAAVKDAYQQRGLPLDDQLRAWGGDVASTQLADVDPTRAMWSARAVPGAAASADPWVIQERQSADGKKAPFLSSLPKGERLTGLLRSRAFAAPAKVSFFIAGHCGQPGTDAPVRNQLRLRDADTGATLKEITPPRDDTAQRIEWDLSEFAGKQVSLELSDGDDAGGYAWFAVGRFEPAVLTVDLPQGAWRSAAELARDARAAGAAPALARLVAAPTVDDDIRVIAAEGIEVIAADPHQKAILTVIADAQASTSLRGRLAAIAARHPDWGSDAVLSNVLNTAAWELQVPVAAALAGSAHGAALLVDLVGQGKAPARVLLDRQVAERLTAQAALTDKITALTKNLPPVSAEKDALIRERIAAFRSAKLPADAITQGQQVFTVSCSLCHRIGGKGALVGPQLDGVGVRGPERLLEDILDPNRNVDHAFRQSVLTLGNGQVVLGMVRREEGETLIVADMTGKETAVAKNQIANRSDSSTSLMPDIFAHTVTTENLSLLVSYLLSQR